MILQGSLFAVFLILSTMDWLLTRTILGSGGCEVNPLMSIAYKYTGMTGIGAIKAIIAVCVAQWQINGTLPNWAMGICIVAYAATVIHLWREVGKVDVRARAESINRLIDPRKFGVWQWLGLFFLVGGPLTTLLIWEVESDRAVQLIYCFAVMAAITVFATAVYYPKIGDPVDSKQWPKSR